MKRDNAKKIYFKVEVGPGVAILIVLAMIIYVATKYFQAIKLGQPFSFSVTLIESIATIIINVIVIALVSLIIEITTLKKYTQDIVEQTVTNITPLFSNENKPNYSRMQIFELEECLNSIIYQLAIKKRLEQKISIPIYKGDIENYNLSLIHKMINDLVVGEYYEDYDINLRLKIIDKYTVLFNNTTSYIVHNGVNKSFDFQASLPSIITCESLHFDKFIISSPDRKKIYYDLTEEINNNIELIDVKSKQHHHNVYCLHSKVDFYSVPTNDYYIEFSRSYKKYIKNGVLVHSLPKPIKNFQAEFWLENDFNNKYKLYGISFFPYKQVKTQLDLKLSEITNSPHNMIFRNQNWCLPGSGFTLTLLENLDQPEDLERYSEFKKKNCKFL